MKLIKHGILLIIFFSYLSAHGVQFINITREPVYFSVFYKTSKSIIRQIQELYTAEPNGKYFIANNKFDHKDANLKIATFPWPKQKCVKFDDAELAALAAGVGVGAAAAGAVVGAGVGLAAGASLAGEGAAASFIGAGTGMAIVGGAGAIGGGAGGVVGVLEGDRPCKAEHYPRTVLFSFKKADIEHLKYDRKLFPLLQRGTGLYFGDNVDGGETHFLFYNTHGFDPRYAAYGKVEGHSAIKGERINSVWYERSKPLLADALRYYLRFAEYMLAG